MILKYLKHRKLKKKLSKLQQRERSILYVMLNDDAASDKPHPFLLEEYKKTKQMKLKI